MAFGVPTVNEECFCGEDFTPSYAQQDNNGTAVNITGWTLVKTIKDKDKNPTFTKTINCTITDAVNGKYKAIISGPTINATIPVGGQLHDLWRTNLGSEWVVGIGAYTIKTERRVTPP